MNMNPPELQRRLTVTVLLVLCCAPTFALDVDQLTWTETREMAGTVVKYSEQERVELKNQAEGHAILLSRNTQEPYHSVGACRAYCGELAEIQDKRND